MRIRTSRAMAGFVAAAALALTGCGGDDSDKKKDPAETTAGAPTATAAGDSPGSDAGAVDSTSVQGRWAGKTEGTGLLITVTGTKVTLVAGGGTACAGEVADHGDLMLSLKCPDGATERTMGTIKSADGERLVVDWGNGLTDSLAKAQSGKLPSGQGTGDSSPES
ncbi:hypothetical protein ABT354_05415 [Streptomyces sp. NPDC000594]|uniref:hypothetical protein n=1 Tax=Streptomyces sp. NPDC000594 TaxID=3154261 RepID=UPI00332D9CB1